MSVNRAGKSTLIKACSSCQCSLTLFRLRATGTTSQARQFTSRPSSPTSRSSSESTYTQRPASSRNQSTSYHDRSQSYSQRDYDTPRNPRTGYRQNDTFRPQNVAPTRQRKLFAVNESTDVLNSMYIRLLGSGGDKLLSEDVKWQCVTHKGFDHAMQPYNNKLAFYGKQIAHMYATAYLLKQHTSSKTAPEAEIFHNTSANETKLVEDNTQPSDVEEGVQEDEERQDLVPKSAFVSPTEETTFNSNEQKLPPWVKKSTINVLKYDSASDLLSDRSLMGIVRASGLEQCLRWKPKDSSDYEGSGVVDIATNAIFAIIGAIALQRGGSIANSVIEKRILAGITDKSIYRG